MIPAKTTAWRTPLPVSVAVTISRAGRPGTGWPPGAAFGASRSKTAAGDPPARSGRTLATDAACRASSASNWAVPEFGSPSWDRTAGVLPVTPGTRVRMASRPSGSGAAGGRSTRRSAPVAKLAWS